jgi:geranylgeranyl pyrophosphate synthase/predicted secreted hydrolase
MNDSFTANWAPPQDWPGPDDLLVPARDDRPHASAGIEWWYLNFHLTDQNQREYSAFLSFFQTTHLNECHESGDTLLSGHLLTWAIYDVSANRYAQDAAVDDAGLQVRRQLLRSDPSVEPNLRRAVLEVLDRGVPGGSERLLADPVSVSQHDLALRYGEAASLCRQPDGSYWVVARTASESSGLDLVFHPTKPATRHGTDGIVEGSPTDEAMFYYFIPRGTVAGTLLVDGHQQVVTSGVGWYDHEFGARIGRLGKGAEDSTDRKESSWHWAGIHLDNGWDLTFCVLYDHHELDGSPTVRHRPAVAVSPAGERIAIIGFDFLGAGEWTSMHTFNTYPTTWRIRTDQLGIDLTLTAAAAQQECTSLMSRDFWEGRVTVSGTMAGVPVSGLAFVEVVPERKIDSMERFLTAPGEEVRRQIRMLYPDRVNDETAASLIGRADPDLLQHLPYGDLQTALVQPVRHMVDNGGKCWRPFMLMIAIQLAGGDGEPYQDMMSVVELMHVGAEIVDDVQDSSTVRRGVAATHTIFGEPIAINAGCATYFAFDRVMSTISGIDTETRLDIYRAYLSTMRAAHAGQALDLLAHDVAMANAVESGDAVSIEGRVLATHRLKTGAPVRGLAEIAALLTGCSDTLSTALTDYFENVGLAYQIADDVLDLRRIPAVPQARSRDVPSRPLGEDIRTGKVSFPLARAVRLLPPKEMRELWRTIAGRPTDAATVGQCIDTLLACGAADASLAYAGQLVDDAWGRLKPLVENSRPGILARAMGTFAVHRHTPR